jgi:nitrite reductase (NO-forming)
LIIWSVPEGFGGPYGPGSTDIGTGIVYALASILFLVAMAAFGPSSLSLDSAIERKWPSWKRLAEIKSD